MIEKARLDGIYRQYNRREYVHPDPLEFLYRYPDIRDREVAGLIASSLAYGRVSQILRSVETVLCAMGSSPADYVAKATERDLAGAFGSFKHRFTPGCDIIALVSGMRNAIGRHGSLNACFIAGAERADETVLPALGKFVAELGQCGNYLLPCPAKGSACKRLNLFLRWMVREDAVDPGGWTGISPGKLIVPLDTHMAKIGRRFGFTGRRAADMRTALEITESFRKFSPDDPVKYDFSLTRFGIHPSLDLSDLPG